MSGASLRVRLHVACALVVPGLLACSDAMRPTAPAPLLGVTGSTVTDLGTLAGGTESQAYALTDNPVVIVVGYGTTSTGAKHAFRYRQSSGMADLGTLAGGSDSYALTISKNNEVAGVAMNAAGQPRAVRWSSSVAIAELGTLGGTESYAFGINDGGTIVGYSTNAAGQPRAFRWTSAGGMLDLGTLPGGTASYAHAISDNGTIVGTATTGTGELRAFSWTQAGGMVDLGLVLGADGGDALAVNDSGHVVGFNHFPDLNYVRAFRWRPTGLAELNVGLIAPGMQSAAFGINSKGQIAGYRSYLDATTGTYRFEAFVWTSDAGGASLGMLPGGKTCHGHDIAMGGQVVGSCTTAAGVLHAVLWNVTYQ